MRVRRCIDEGLLIKCIKLMLKLKIAGAWFWLLQKKARFLVGGLSEAFPTTYLSLKLFYTFCISKQLIHVLLGFFFYFGFNFKKNKMKWKKMLNKIKILNFFLIITIRYYIALLCFVVFCCQSSVSCCLIVILIASITPRFKVKCLW